MGYTHSTGTTGSTVQVTGGMVQIVLSKDSRLVYEVPTWDVPQHLLSDLGDLYDWMMDVHVAEISARLDEMGL